MKLLGMRLAIEMAKLVTEFLRVIKFTMAVVLILVTGNGIGKNVQPTTPVPESTHASAEQSSFVEETQTGGMCLADENVLNDYRSEEKRLTTKE